MAYPSKHMEKGEVLGALLEKAEVQGYLTIEDIAEICPWGETDHERLNDIISYLRRQGIEVTDELTEQGPSSFSESPLLDFDSNVALEHISTDDSVGLYLKEMSRVPLLSLEEELSLAKRVERGRQAKRDLTYIGNNYDELKRQELEGYVQDGLLGREHLIKANTRLVVSIAKKYMGRGVPFLDLIQEGNLGLMKSVEKFDYKRLSFFYLCHLVDPADSDTRNCRSGTNDPCAGTYD